MATTLRVAGGTVVTEIGETRADVIVRDGVIAGIVAPAGALRAGGAATDETLDATGLLVLPGSVDVHTHAYDPDPQGREGFDTLTRAAAAGGVTTVVEMPMSEPAATSGATFRARVPLIEAKAVVDVAMYGAMTHGQPPASLDAMRAAGASAFKAFLCGGSDVMPPIDDAELVAALEAARRHGTLLTVHCENDALLRAGVARMHAAGRTDPLAHAESRPPVVEAEATRRAMFLAEQTGAHVHIAHVSCALAAEAIREARARGARVTAETCPQYLVLDEGDLARLGPWATCAPPLRPRPDVEAVWDALRDGTLDLVCSDHCGFTVESKRAGEANIFAAPMGVATIQGMLPVVYDEAVHRRGWSWSEIVTRTGANPARIFGLAPRKGSIAVGADADLALYDPDARWTVRPEEVLHRNKWMPFAGRAVRGRVVRTLVRGVTVFAGGEIRVPGGFGQFLAASAG